MEEQGEIYDLRVHPKPWFSLDVNGVHICSYAPDFTYWVKEEFVVEDVKGFLTETYKLKAKLMLACHGIEILET